MSNMESTPQSLFELADAADGFKEIVPKPDRKELEQYYHNKYYQEGLGSYEVSYSPEELAYFENRLKRFHFLIRKYLPDNPNPQLLDIGCGEGFASAFFSRQGFAVKSLDYSSAGIVQQNPDMLATHEVGDLFNLLQRQLAEKQLYDILILQNVLEHVIDPYGLCEIIKRLLKPNGISLITVPNDFSITQLTAKQEGLISREFWISPPDHLSYFNTVTLRRFLTSQGLNTLDMITDFPVDWYLFHPGSNYVEDESKGKSVHQARITIENMLHSAPIEDVVGFYRSAAQLGIGRDITIVVKPPG